MILNITALLIMIGAVLGDASIPLSPANTTVTFEVNSTWHLVEGKVRQLSGTMTFERPGDFSSAHVRVELPVDAFDTDSERRDRRMREVMHSTEFPAVVFEGGPIKGECSISTLEEGKSCQDHLPGTLSISGHTEPVELPIAIERQKGSYRFVGDAAFEWSTFGVEDPSIIVAKLDKSVRVRVEVVIPEK